MSSFFVFVSLLSLVLTTTMLGAFIVDRTMWWMREYDRYYFRECWRTGDIAEGLFYAIMDFTPILIGYSVIAVQIYVAVFLFQTRQ